MAFDVAIGKCRNVSPESVEVWVDGSIVRRLAPETKWQRDGISVLHVPRSLCSSRHRLAAGDEVYLDTALINARSQGKLDVDGSGNFSSPRLTLLVPEMDTIAAMPEISRKPRWR